MPYIDGYVAPVPTKNKEIYRQYAEKSWQQFKELGALELVEAWGDDVPAGKVTDLQRSVQLQDDETVVFSWCIWPDKATRDAAYKKMAEDPSAMNDMPFDGKRMIYGGFEPLVHVKR